ncbi:glycosyltransferase [Micromonospora sp. NBC_01813]|uniref:glycosyltransferase n=1 Tax=Micromonospora sp. NBC_01813 TaxID=2975988 RepID=UPI002DD913C3|nr:glycosyltransferase [Micromonospora sp. NBC_01813]WSA10806.1 glycosyltransferase [Micromonospora sp. NBC_01813]
MSARTPPTLGVVVCTYTDHREAGLGRLIDAVTAELGPADRLYVVVDHNPSLAGRIAEQTAAAVAVTVLENTRSRGLSGARNCGVEAGGEDVVVFFDDDAVPRTGWAAAVHERFARTDSNNADIVGGAVTPVWAGRAQSPAWFPPEYGWVVGCDYPGLPGDGARVRNPIGACMAVRRQVFDQVGLFTESVGRRGELPIGCEETELAIRLTASRPQARILRDTRLQVDHLVPAQRQRPTYLVRRCFHEGRSKARLVRLAGRAALSTEAAHVSGTLARAWRRDAARLLRGEAAAAARLALSLLGLGCAGAGYLVGIPARRVTPGAPAGGSATRRADVTIVLCTLGTSPHLPDSVEALLRQDLPAIDVVVVDNDPASGTTRTVLSGLADDRLRIVDEPRRGLSHARNRGVHVARSAVVAFTDDDAIADPDWARNLVAGFGDPVDGIVCVTGRVLAAATDTDPQRWFEAGAGFDKGANPLVWRPGPGDDPHPDAGPRGPLYPFAAGEFGSGNNMAFRRSFLLTTGGFAAALGAGAPTRGGEDLDMFRRVVLAGHGLRYEPTAVVRHHHRPTFAALRAQMYAYGTGMAASVTRYALSSPAAFARIVLRLPDAAAMLLSPASPKNIRKDPGYPRALDRAERAGYLAGPVLFLAAATREALSGGPR